MKKLRNLIIAVFASIVLFSCGGKKSNETKPVRKDISETVFASGSLVPENQYNLTAQSEGYIVKLNFDDGDYVQEGEILAVVDNKQSDFNATSANALLSIANANVSPSGPSLKQAETNIELAREKLKLDEIQANRYKKLFENKSVSQLEYENMQLAFETSKSNLSSAKESYNLLKQQAEQQVIIQQSQSGVNNIIKGNNEIKSVVGGRVFKKMKQLGDFVKKGDVIAIIGHASIIYAKLGIDESNISKIKLNQEVIIQLNTNKDKNYKAIISEIFPSFDDQTQSFYCKAKFTDSLDFKISGTQLQANVIIDNRKNVLVIPKEFLGFGSKVKVKGKGEVVIKTGFISNDWVEVLDGVTESDIITK